MPNRALVFVYNADSGLFNTLADIAHKITSPQTCECKLCSLTHNAFAMKKAWRSFVDSNRTLAWRFYHRDEFKKAYPEQTETLPAVFLENEDRLQLVVSREQLESLDDVQGLIELLESLTANGE